MRTALTLLIGATAAFAAGCGPNCQSTCNRLYQEDECNLGSPGMTRTELLSLCLDECEGALTKTGEVGSYDPNEYTPSNESVTLRNDRQAALWMECVANTECEHLNNGYCAPIW